MKIKIAVLLVILFVTQLNSAQEKLPYTVINKIVSQTDLFVINHSKIFAHVDLPRGKYNQFLGYVKDSVATPIPNAENWLYYKWYLKDGTEVNGDIYWKDNRGYIVFIIDNKKYINYFMPDGIAMLKQIFKL